MNRRGNLVLISAVSFTLHACGQPSPVQPAANDLEELPPNVVVDADSPVTPQPTSPRAVETSRPAPPASKEPRMPESHPKPSPQLRPSAQPPRPSATQPVKPRVKTPTEPPRPVILPSPIQPPAEVDPVQPYPGDEVQR